MLYDTWENIYRSFRKHPSDVCAEYHKVMAYKSRFISLFGQAQLEQDYKTTLERRRK